MNNKPLAWEGAEEWEHLAWELCADEHGEESCTDLIWTMDVIPEPWGDRWQKYEDEAKRMIAMVRKCTHPVKEQLKEVELEATFNRGYKEGARDYANKCNPVKEQLTDEEVFNLEQQVYNLAMQVQNQKAEIEALHKEREGLCVFCENRAILRKAQEK